MTKFLLAIRMVNICTVADVFNNMYVCDKFIRSIDVVSVIETSQELL